MRNTITTLFGLILIIGSAAVFAEEDIYLRESKAQILLAAVAMGADDYQLMGVHAGKIYDKDGYQTTLSLQFPRTGDYRLIGVSFPPTAMVESETREACAFMHGLLRRCYAAGVSQTINSCADLTIDLLGRNESDNLGDQVVMLCGMACASGTRNSGGLAAFNQFLSNTCRL